MFDSENRKTLGIIVECAKMTPEIFAKAVSEMINSMTNSQTEGKTSLNKLSKTGKLDSIEVSDSNIGSFSQTARKYDLTYALKRIQDENGKKQYLVCFKGKDLETMQRAFKEYSYNQTHRKETLFSKKKVMAIDLSAHNREKDDRQLDKNKQRKKERNSLER
ncbi:MAG: PcfB family protein [Ruminococcus sp.]|nr:PcfB family protein [Ruminococcus sp.]